MIRVRVLFGVRLIHLKCESFCDLVQNKIRILVANTAMNYMAGQSLPDYRLLNLRYGERFQPQDMDKIQPLPSGLLGPMRLISTKSASQD